MQRLQVGIFLDCNATGYSFKVSQASQISHSIVVRNLEGLLTRVLANRLQTAETIHVLQIVVVVHDDATLRNLQIWQSNACQNGVVKYLETTTFSIHANVGCGDIDCGEVCVALDKHAAWNGIQGRE
jgi:hypothetical protein